MTSESESRLPLTLLGGFLGSGKTTWLRHQLHHGNMADALIVVNETADVPVDDMLLFKSSEIRVLAGGCACCEGRDNLIALLRAVCDQRVDDRYEGVHHRSIVLETSGLANPEPIVDAIRTDPVLMHHIVVREIIVAVDALHGIGYLKTEPLGLRQVETADRLIITKVDAAGGDAVGQLRATLEAISPGAAMTASVMGSEVPLPEVGDATAADLQALDGGDDRPVVSASIRFEPGIDWTAFGIWLSALLHARGDDFVRVKGVVRTPSGRLLLQSVRKVVQSPEVLPDYVAEGKDDNCVVFIGRGFNPKDLKTSLRRFAGLAVEEDGVGGVGGAH
jgi:G3E family GTPase